MKKNRREGKGVGQEQRKARIEMRARIQFIESQKQKQKKLLTKQETASFERVKKGGEKGRFHDDEEEEEEEVRYSFFVFGASDLIESNLTRSQ
ncbi:unnamed protein product [Caenorhabditis nigoni]